MQSDRWRGDQRAALKRCTHSQEMHWPQNRRTTELALGRSSPPSVKNYRRSLRRDNRGGGDSAAMTVPHALITVGITVANCGATSFSARSTALSGMTAASIPTMAMAAPNTARVPDGRPGEAEY
jgi:hypothetical protein